MNQTNAKRTRMLAEGAVMVALATVLSKAAAAVWSDPNSMELRYDGNSYQQIITQSLAAEAQQQGADVKSELYYDDIGNCYITINISGVSNRMKFNNNVIMKKTRQIFKKLK